MAAKSKFIIDTDAGIDDAQAIFMALAAPDVHVLAITCVNGNASAAQVGKNVLRILQQAKRLQVPVYVGCNEPLLGDIKPASDYHGLDGFGDVPDPNAPDQSYIESEHAVQALLRMSREDSGEVFLVCLGALTNIAVALRLDPLFGRRLNHCYIMGGNYQGKGNTTASAEFNFYADPEAAYVVLNQLGCPITLVPWEVCEEHSLPWNQHKILREIASSKSQFLANIERHTLENFLKPIIEKNPSKQYELADEIAMALALDPNVALDTAEVYVTVELQGEITKGQAVMDWNYTLKKPANVKVVKKVNTGLILRMLSEGLQ